MIIKKFLALKNIKGFSLVEVLVFTTILGLFFVAVISVAVFNLKNMKTQEYKILATRYAEEGIEWIKQEKESNWMEFINRGSAEGTVYCLNSLIWSAGSCEDYSLGTPAIYKRELLIKNSGDTVLTVYWKDMNTVLSISTKTVFKLLE